MYLGKLLMRLKQTGNLPSIILALKLSRFFELNVNDLFVLEDEIYKPQINN